jgi:hypothetical protein
MKVNQAIEWLGVFLIVFGVFGFYIMGIAIYDGVQCFVHSGCFVPNSESQLQEFGLVAASIGAFLWGFFTGRRPK